MAWVDDGTGSGHSEGATVFCTSDKKGDAKFNFMWQNGEGLSAGSKYWEISLDEGADLFVGLTTPSKFKKGYGLRGYMYGGPGNLADGSALLKGHWGPEFKSGDKVGILANAGADKLDVDFFINGSYVGRAFSLNAPYISPLYPLISFGKGNQKATIDESASAPRAEHGEPEPATGLEGTWTLSNPYDQGMLPTLTVKQQGENAYRFQAKCANSIWTVATLAAGGQWTSGPCASTMMFSQRWSNTEQRISALLSSISTVEVSGDSLLITSSEGDERTFQRAAATRPEPVTEVDLD